MKIGRRSFLEVSFVSLSLWITGGVAHARHPTVRWDIVSVDFTTTPNTFRPGGIASARANDNSKITLTSSGTFRLNPDEGEGDPGNPQATGGGNWTTFGPAGNLTGSGTYQVTGLVRFDHAPGMPVGGGNPNDLIGNPANARPGFAVLSIEYSDGSEAILVVSCTFAGQTPPAVFEGVRQRRTSWTSGIGRLPCPA